MSSISKKKVKVDEIKRQKKYFLKGYIRCNNKISRLQNKLGEIDEEITNLKSQEITDMPRGGKAQTIDDLLIRKEEIEERLMDASNFSIETRRKIVNKIDELDDYRHIEILEAFFIEDLTLEEISERENYSLRHTCRMYGEAIKLLNIDVSK